MMGMEFFEKFPAIHLLFIIAVMSEDRREDSWDERERGIIKRVTIIKVAIFMNKNKRHILRTEIDLVST